MKRFALLAMFTAVVVPRTASVAAPSDAAGTDLYKRMLALNGDLRSYRATVHVDVALRSFPFLSPTLDGSAYYQAPDRQAVVFDTVPSLASQFRKLYPNLDPPSRWQQLYDVTAGDDKDGLTSFRLVPKKTGRVARLDVRVDDATATIRGYTWTYTDGGFVTFDQTFTSVGRDYLVARQSGHVELPSYKADVVSNFSNYQLNVAIPSDIFDAS